MVLRRVVELSGLYQAGSSDCACPSLVGIACFNTGDPLESAFAGPVQKAVLAIAPNAIASKEALIYSWRRAWP
jgi:hypothetical protein